MEQEQTNNSEKQTTKNEPFKTMLLRWLRNHLKMLLQMLLKYFIKKTEKQQ